MRADFSDIYSNRSDLSREMQNCVFQSVYKAIGEVDKESRSGLHYLCFRHLSDSPFREYTLALLPEGDAVLFGEYAEGLKPESMTIVSAIAVGEENLEKTESLQMAEYVETAAKELVHRLSFLILPYAVTANAVQQWRQVFENVMDFDSTIIFYKAPECIDFSEGFRVTGSYCIREGETIQVLNSESAPYSEIRTQILQSCVTLCEDTRAMLPNVRQWHERQDNRVIDALIERAQELEDFAAVHFDEIRIAPLKDQMNEIKNALLDLRYADSTELEYYKTPLKELLLV